MKAKRGKNVYCINVRNKVINKYGSWWISSNINQCGYIEHPLSDFEDSLDRFFTISNTFS